MIANKTTFISIISALFLTVQVSATTVTLKDGRSFEGQIKSQDTEKIVLDMDGLEMTLPVKQVSTIDMSEVATRPPKKQVAPQQDNSSMVTVAAGTVLRVSLDEGFNSRNNKTGQRFTAVLVGNLVSGETIVAAKGSQVYGVLTNVKRAGRLAGSAELRFELTDISINGTLFPLKTQNQGGQGANTAKSTLGGTARAAAIGGLIDGSDGAKTGAKVGVGVAVLTRGNDIQIPKGEILDFTLSAPFTAK